jgi:2'-5' RNA ligase
VHRDTHAWAVERGIPFHVTILYPFVPRALLGDAELERVRGVLSRHASFDFELARLETWPRVVWLAPEPAEPFRALTHALHAEFPEQPPYGGAFDEVVPHATLGEGDGADALAAALAPRARPLLPYALRADAVTLLVEDEPDRWRPEARLPLG